MFKKVTITIIAILLLCLILGCSSEKEVYKFTFNPPDGIQCYENSIKDRIYIENGDTLMNQEFVQTIETSYNKTGDSYVLHQDAESLKLLNNGVETDDPVLEAMTDIDFYLTINNKAEMVSCSTSVDPLDVILENIPEESREVYIQTFSPEAIEARIAQEWNSNVVEYVGLEATVGDVFESVDTIPVPLGFEVVCKSTVKIEKIVEIEGVKCLLIVRRYTSQSDDLMAGLSNYFMETFAALNLEMDDYNIKEAIYTGVETRLIDPATMLIHDITDTLRLSFTVDSESMGSMSMSQLEIDDRVFEYSNESE